MPSASELVSLDRMRLELRFPEADNTHDEFITQQVRSAFAWVAWDLSLDIEALAADDARIPALQILVVVIARSLYDGARTLPKGYDRLALSLRRMGRA